MRKTGPTDVSWKPSFPKGPGERKQRDWCGHYNLKTGSCKLRGGTCKTDSSCPHFWKRKKPKVNVSGEEKFKGIKDVEIDKIIVNAEFKYMNLKEEEINIIRSNISSNIIFDSVIYLDYIDNKYYLRKESLAEYFVAKEELHLNSIPTVILTNKQVKVIEKIKSGQDIVNDKYFGKGQIKFFDNRNIVIKFLDKEYPWDLYPYIQSDRLSFDEND